MSVQLTPSKRPFDQSHVEPNGKGKWQKSSSFTSQSLPLKVTPGSSSFRVLCPVSVAGSVIGKGGSIIAQIRQETGAKVRVEETVPGCDERVVVIIGSDKEDETTGSQSRGGDDQANATKDGDDAKEQGEDDENRESIPVGDFQSEKGMAPVQKALLLVFERLVEGEAEIDGGNEESKKPSTIVVRLLVFSSQVGCLLGKGGSVIKQMSSESAAQIRILPRDKLPSCASPSDELVQISGAVDAVKRALQLVSQQLMENPPRDQDSFFTNSGVPSSHSFGNPLPRPDSFILPNFPFPAQGSSYATGPLISRHNDGGIPGRVNPNQDILTFRLLCHEDKVGAVIGKGGTIVKALQHETGCEIKVVDGGSDSEERIIVISGPAHPDDRISPAQDGVLRVQSRIVRATSESKENSVTAKLLVSSNQIGCLLGKGGAIIAEMRKLSGAYIRILGKDQVPKFASENEELVQINGEFETVQDALLHVTSRLRNHFFRDAFPSINHPPNPAFPDQVPPFPYVGRREHSPPGMYFNRGPSFPKFDAVGGLPPREGFHPHDDRIPFMHRPGVPPHISERKPAWGPQGSIEGGGHLGLPDYGGAPQRRMAGLGGGSHQAIITNTTVEVVVPRSVVPVIYGEDGGCLKQIREDLREPYFTRIFVPNYFGFEGTLLEISDAKVTITDPKPGATETVIIISGTPEQTHAAQSLIQAFVISETKAS